MGPLGDTHLHSFLAIGTRFNGSQILQNISLPLYTIDFNNHVSLKEIFEMTFFSHLPEWCQAAPQFDKMLWDRSVEKIDLRSLDYNFLHCAGSKQGLCFQYKNNIYFSNLDRPEAMVVNIEGTNTTKPAHYSFDWVGMWNAKFKFPNSACELQFDNRDIREYRCPPVPPEPIDPRPQSDTSYVSAIVITALALAVIAGSVLAYRKCCRKKPEQTPLSALLVQKT